MRFLGMLRADEHSEAGTPPSRELMEKMGQFIEEITRAGVLLATDGLHPSSRGARVKLEDGKFSVVDGPFTESKELVASYALFEVKSKEEAIEWTKRFLSVLGEGECEIRQIFDPADFSPDIFPPEQAAHEEALRAEMTRRASAGRVAQS
ncbi:MAG: YciI family protein [Candidatus Eisenbacteria bacterium]|nr:YciI family protein [Candidatus Eisenbacteria bacterium]